MNFRLSILKCLCLYIPLTLFVFGQGRFEAIEPLPGDVRSGIRGVSPDGKHIVAWSANSDNTVTRSFIWKGGQTTKIFGTLPGATRNLVAVDISQNGEYVAGTGDNAGGLSEAFRWKASTNTFELLGFLASGNTSYGGPISDDGQYLAGSSFNGSFLEGWRWTNAGSMQGIGDLPGGSEYSSVESISGDGSTLMGWSRTGDENFPHAFRWTAGGGMQDLGVLPGGYIGSHARASTLDGSVVVGSCTRVDSTGETIQAFRWTADGGMEGLGWLPGARRSRSFFITNDGNTIIGTSDAPTPLSYFIWDDSLGMRYFNDFLTNERGIDIGGWTIIGITDMSADGKVIVGIGNDPSGVRKGWQVVLSDIAINAPKTAERWVVGKKDSIRWNGPNTMFYNIDLSLDDGANWTNLDFTTSPGDTMITYKVPDNTRTTDKARVRVSNLFDSTAYAISDRFTIKGYDLTRIMPDSSLQNFDLMKHSWQFGNLVANLWPMSWWQQYNYAGGDDPITSERYPSDWPLAPMNASPVNFPPWPTFVQAFSEDQAYWSVFFARYKESAEEYWRSSKGTWGGSCFGMAYTSILAFDYPTQFLANNPGIAQADSIHALFINTTIRKAMNREFSKQYAGEVLANDVIGKPKSPRTLLQEAKDLFLDETKDGRPLTFFRNNASSAHTVLPYRLARDASQSNIWRLYVYDNSNPNQLNRFIYIDSTANTWTDSVFNAWGTGSTRCYLELPSGNFLQEFTMGPLETLEADPMLRLYTGVDNEVLITDATGGTIGYQDSSDFNTMSEGIAIIPKTGSFSPPIGYYLPSNDYAATLSEFSNTEAVFSSISGNTIYRYSRSDADFSQQDHIYAGNGLQILNEDAATKDITLTAIVTQDSSERKISASELAVVDGDSLDFKLLPDDQLQLANFGAAKSYQLQISTASPSKVDSFNHNLVSIAANSTHQIAANWDDLNQSVTIYIDLDNDGSIDDSTVVINQPVGIDDTPQMAEIPEEFELLQNYPNPFNPTTNIGFRISDFGFTELAIYDVTGRLVKTLVSENRAPGIYTEQWDATNQAGEKVGSGVYFYQLRAKNFQQVRKMLLLK